MIKTPLKLPERFSLRLNRVESRWELHLENPVPFFLVRGLLSMAEVRLK